MSQIAVLHLYKVGDDIVVAMNQRWWDDEQRFVMGLVFRHVQVSAGAEELGQSLIAALDESAELPPADADPKVRYKQWQQAISQGAGYDSWRAFQQAALLVDVLRYEDGKIQIAPAARVGTGFILLHEKMETLHAPTPAQLGTAAQRAFRAIEDA